MPDDEPQSSRRRLWILAGFCFSLFFLSGWFDQSIEQTLEVDAPTRLVIVSDAGPVGVSSIEAGQAAAITRRDSWLFSEPRFETVESVGETVVRVTCPGRFPCRSALHAEVPVGTEVIVVATTGVVDVQSHTGSLTVYSSASDGVVLGPVGGSARIVSRGGPISGFHLALDDLDVEADQSPVRISFSASPMSVRVSGSEELVQIAVPQRFYRVDIETGSASVEVGVHQSINSDRGIEVVANGPVQVVVSDE